MNVFFIRHGETYANAEKKFAGFWDVSLNENGKKQAASVGERLSNVKINKIYASDLVRAHDTAKAIAAHHQLEVQLEPRLREMNFGDWEQKSFSDLRKESPDAMEKWINAYDTFKVPGGESVSELYHRASAAYDAIIGAHDINSDENVAIVAHGGVIQALLSHLCYKDISGYWRFAIDNCGINRVEYVMGYPVIKKING